MPVMRISSSPLCSGMITGVMSERSDTKRLTVCGFETGENATTLRGSLPGLPAGSISTDAGRLVERAFPAAVNPQLNRVDLYRSGSLSH